MRKSRYHHILSYTITLPGAAGSPFLNETTTPRRLVQVTSRVRRRPTLPPGGLAISLNLSTYENEAVASVCDTLAMRAVGALRARYTPAAISARDPPAQYPRASMRNKGRREGHALGKEQSMPSRHAEPACYACTCVTLSPVHACVVLSGPGTADHPCVWRGTLGQP